LFRTKKFEVWFGLNLLKNLKIGSNPKHFNLLSYFVGTHFLYDSATGTFLISEVRVLIFVKIKVPEQNR